MNDKAIVIESRITPEVEAAKNLVIVKMERLKAIKEEKRVAREMLHDMLDGDVEYHNTTKEVEEATKKRKVAKARIMQDKQAFAANQKIKELAEEYKEVKEDIGEYLTMYADRTGQLSFLTPSGSEVIISRTARATVIPEKLGKGKYDNR
jgi:seryl-tRNA synthetase